MNQVAQGEGGGGDVVDVDEVIQEAILQKEESFRGIKGKVSAAFGGKN